MQRSLLPTSPYVLLTGLGLVQKVLETTLWGRPHLRVALGDLRLTVQVTESERWEAQNNDLTNRKDARSTGQQSRGQGNRPKPKPNRVLE